MLLDVCSTRLRSFGWMPLSTLGWKPAAEFLASLASGEHSVAAEDAMPATLSPTIKRAKAPLTDGSFSGRPATPRGIDLTAVGPYFPFSSVLLARMDCAPLTGSRCQHLAGSPHRSLWHLSIRGTTLPRQMICILRCRLRLAGSRLVSSTNPNRRSLRTKYS